MSPFFNPVKRYLDLFVLWVEDDMPSDIMKLLDRAWDKLSQEEKKMAVKLIAEELKSGLLHRRSNKAPRVRFD